jgi:hypothetical protein
MFRNQGVRNDTCETHFHTLCIQTANCNMPEGYAGSTVTLLFELRL